MYYIYGSVRTIPTCRVYQLYDILVVNFEDFGGRKPKLEGGNPSAPPPICNHVKSTLIATLGRPLPS